VRLYGGAATLALPWAALWAALDPRMGRHWQERVGGRLPVVEPGALWLHAASLGEGQAAAALAEGLSARAPDLPLLRTATSETGREQVLPVDDVRCLALDAPWLHRRFLRRVRPRALVLVEGELWPGLLLACSGRVPVAMVGLRVGEGTRRFARRLPRLWRGMLGAVESWSARGEEDATWIEGWLDREVPRVGDLKLEAPLTPSALSFPRPLLLAGSTRDGDEEAVLDAWAQLRPAPQLVLAPRHADRFDRVASLLDERGLRWRRRSELGGGALEVELQVLLLDTVGELAGLYPHARAAFVGGTFDPSIGGHSAAEASRAGVTVVHGPHIGANEVSFARGYSLPVASPGELAGAFRRALAEPRPPPVTGFAVELALQQLEPLLAAPVPPEVESRPWLAPLAPAYRGIARLRARRPRAQALCPVVSVGNIASGGTGKTPVARLILERLRRRGRNPALLTRGYGREPGPRLRDSVEGPVSGAWLGDEPAMIAGLGFTVVSCPDRREGLARALALGADCCVLDDGFQQRDLVAGLDIVVVDARWPRAGGVVPVGTAREPLSAVSRAHLLWCNHGPLPPELGPGSSAVVEAALEPRGWRRGGVQHPLEDGPRGRVAVLCGIAEPAGFLRSLRSMGLVPAQRLLYPDHHAWGPAELARIHREAGSLPVVTTEKDLTRMAPELGAWALRVELVIRRGEEALDAALDRLLAPGPGGEA
jgi:tetraacyldisaccharide 4'-kinase